MIKIDFRICGNGENFVVQRMIQVDGFVGYWDNISGVFAAQAEAEVIKRKEIQRYIDNSGPWLPIDPQRVETK